MKTLKQAETLIKKEQDRLISIAQTKGLYENFGQQEVARVDKSLGYPNYCIGTERELAKLVMNFDNWCINFTL